MKNRIGVICVVVFLLGYTTGHIVGCYHEKTSTVSKAVRIGSEVKDSLLNRLK